MVNQKRHIPRGSAILIQDNGCLGFLLKQSEDKYCLFGGEEEPGEHPEQTLRRALGQEWSDKTMVLDVMSCVFALPPVVLPARRPGGGSYILQPYLTSAKDIQQFKDWMGILLDDERIQGGRAVYLSRDQLVAALEFPDDFSAGTHIFLRRHLSMLLNTHGMRATH
jgi:hypothetical protein